MKIIVCVTNNSNFLKFCLSGRWLRLIAIKTSYMTSVSSSPEGRGGGDKRSIVRRRPP